MRPTRIAFLLLPVLLAACRVGGGNEPVNCVPGTTLTCACLGGAGGGVQVCDEKGWGFGACECPDTGAPADAGAETVSDVPDSGTPEACTPHCEALHCGDDGCGGSCGDCPELYACVEGFCQCAGVCPARFCTKDNDCLPGEACNAAVVPAACLWPGEEGTPCTKPGNCLAGLYCRDGLCRDGSVGDPCVDTGECALSNVCGVLGKCRFPAAQGEPCLGRADCGAGLVCVLQACEPGGTVGAPCASDDHCLAGTWCIQGACRAAAGPGGTCVTNEQCAGGLYCHDSCPGDDCAGGGKKCFAGTGGDPCSLVGAGGAVCQAGLVCHGLFSPPRCRKPDPAGSACWCTDCSLKPQGTCAAGLVCNTALGPVTGKPVGECGPPGVAGGLCDLDGQCGPGLVCNQAFKPRRCALPGIEDTPCSRAIECASGLVCNSLWHQCRFPGTEGIVCGTPLDCEPGLSCNAAYWPTQCRPPGQAGAACGSTLDCVAGLVCSTVTGTLVCRKPGGAGTECADAADCQAGLWCDAKAFTCGIDPEEAFCNTALVLGCPAGYSCVPEANRKVCHEAGQEGSWCLEDVHCEGGLICVLGHCLPSSGKGVPCLADVQCDAGLWCHQSVCRSLGALGEPCLMDGHCNPGLWCIVAACRPKSGPGGPCEEPKDCAPGLLCNAALQPIVCAAPSTQPGSPCGTPQDCAGGLHCAPDHSCVAGLEGDACLAGDAGICLGGLVCNQWYSVGSDGVHQDGEFSRCKAPGGKGDPCFRTEDCGTEGDGKARMACTGRACSALWKVERLDPAGFGQAAVPVPVVLDGQGHLHLFLADWNGFVHRTDAQGAWASSPIQGAGVRAVVAAFRRQDGAFVVIGQADASFSGGVKIGILAGEAWSWRDAGVFGPGADAVSAALDPEERLHLAGWATGADAGLKHVWETSGGLVLYEDVPAGDWSTGGTALAVSASGDVHLVMGGGNYWNEMGESGYRYARRLGKDWTLETVTEAFGNFWDPTVRPAVYLDPGLGPVLFLPTGSGSGAGLAMGTRSGEGWQVVTLCDGEFSGSIAGGPLATLHATVASEQGVVHLKRSGGPWDVTAIDPVNALAATLGAGPDGRIHLLYWDWVEQGAAEWGGHYRLSHAWQAIPGGGQ